LRINKLTEIELLALLSAASVLRKTKSFKYILQYLVMNNYSEIKIYEALLQTYLFAGFPSALVSLKTFNRLVQKSKVYDGYHLKKYLTRGRKNCRTIYGDKYDKLISNVKSFSPEMSEWLIIDGYGKVLGRKGLKLTEREVCIVAILSALKFKDQLYSHINGAIRLKVGYELIKSVINNLEIISAQSSKNFGLNVLNDYRSKKEH
jgi:alkylhydroperoxidase/carboxymuconolactone decarboxylase family protein YurZ